MTQRYYDARTGEEKRTPTPHPDWGVVMKVMRDKFKKPTGDDDKAKGKKGSNLNEIQKRARDIEEDKKDKPKPHYDGKVKRVMGEFKRGQLHSGSSKGPKVKNRKQAIAIGLSEARKAGEKV